MAADDYHENNFIFKTITLVRIAVGVALTLVVLFAMVWLIDYSSSRAPSTHQQVLLFPELTEDQKPQQAQTFFETLLNKSSKPGAAVTERDDSTSDLPRPQVRPEPPPVAPRPKPVPSGNRLAAQSAPSAAGVFAVQLGAFQQAERAQIFSENLAAKGYRPYITNVAMPDGTKTYRVRVGRFATREEAMDLAATIERAEKIAVFVTSQ